MPNIKEYCLKELYFRSDNKCLKWPGICQKETAGAAALADFLKSSRDPHEMKELFGKYLHICSFNP